MTALDTKQKLANNDYFSSILDKTKMFVWKDKGLVYEIRDGKYVCDSAEKKTALRDNTTTKFYNNNTIE
tara:strand:- start:1773 stop:1979 length:207 start_codon:yes stop_codon:yes gene_type:complete